jgi:hypothetical protein
MITTIDNIESYLDKYTGDSNIPPYSLLCNDSEVPPKDDHPIAKWLHGCHILMQLEILTQ